MKIAIYAIAKNEEAFVERFCEQASEADEVVVLVDKSTTDNTFKKLLECCSKYKYLHKIVKSGEEFERFDTQRNKALALVSKDVDFCIALDFDEAIAPGYREQLHECQVGFNLIAAEYYESTSGMTHVVERIHRRNEFTWVNPVHEELYCINPSQYKWKSKIQISHTPDRSKPREYSKLIAQALAENPHNKRFMLYSALDKPEPEAFFKIANMVWNYDHEDRFWHAYSALKYAELDYVAPALAISITPEWDEVWHAAAIFYDKKKQFSRAWFCIEQALGCKPCGRSFQTVHRETIIRDAIAIAYQAGKKREAAALRIQLAKLV